MLLNDKITLLSESEIKAIYALPTFNTMEQQLYFDFTEDEMQLTNRYRTIKARIYFMINLGYFKAKQQFFCFDLNDSEDFKAWLKKGNFTEQKASEIIPVVW